MKEIFTLNTTIDTLRNKLVVKTQRTKSYGTDTLRSLGPKIWNSLPTDMKNSDNLTNIIISEKKCSAKAETFLQAFSKAKSNKN